MALNLKKMTLRAQMWSVRFRRLSLTAVSPHTRALLWERSYTSLYTQPWEQDLRSRRRQRPRASLALECNQVSPCAQKPWRTRSQGLVEMPLARTGLLGRDFFSVLLPKPLPDRSPQTAGRTKPKSFLRFNTQNPGSSIKQQKLNVISSRGTATLLTIAHSDSLSLS